MADLSPIPTPLIYRWRRFLQNIVPFVIFLFGLMFTLWLWDRQSQMGNAFGVAESQYVDVSSGAEGILMPPGHGEWREFQTVKKGEVIGGVRLAQLDTYEAQIATIQKEKAKVLADKEAAKQKFLFDMHMELRQQDDQWFEVRRLVWRIEDKRQDIRDRNTNIDFLRAQARTLRANRQFNENSKRAGGAVSDQVVVDSQLRVKELEKRVERELNAIKAAKYDYARNWKQYQEVKDRLDPNGQETLSKIRDVVKAMVIPFQKQLDVLDAQSIEVQAAMTSSVIKSPIDGVVTQVYKIPGESLQPGDPVVRVASPNSKFVVSYIRQRQRLHPAPKMDVKLRTRHTGSRPVDSTVVEVGPTVQDVPPEHLMDPTRAERGYVVKIAIPKDLQGLIRPGEQVDIIFPHRRSASTVGAADSQGL